MPFIPRQVKPPARQAINCRVPIETVTLLKRYAEFLDSSQEYVVHEILQIAFRRDKEFQAWLATTRAGTPHADTEIRVPTPVERGRS
jgi:hypothetical protein